MLEHRDEITLLIKNLDAVIPTVSNIEPTLGIELHRMRGPELPRSEPNFPPLLDKSPVRRKLEDPPRRPSGWIWILTTVAIRDKDIAIRGRDYVARFVKLTGATTRLTGSAKAEQRFAIWTALNDLATLGSAFITL